MLAEELDVCWRGAEQRMGFMKEARVELAKGMFKLAVALAKLFNVKVKVFSGLDDGTGKMSGLCD